MFVFPASLAAWTWSRGLCSAKQMFQTLNLNQKQRDCVLWGQNNWAGSGLLHLVPVVDQAWLFLAD